MIPRQGDPLATKLDLLPDDPLGPRAASAVLRHARGVLIDEGRPAARVLRAWTTVVLPAVLLACALVYTVGAVQTIERIYVSAR